MAEITEPKPSGGELARRLASGAAIRVEKGVRYQKDAVSAEVRLGVGSTVDDLIALEMWLAQASNAVRVERENLEAAHG